MDSSDNKDNEKSILNVVYNINIRNNFDAHYDFDLINKTSDALMGTCKAHDYKICSIDLSDDDICHKKTVYISVLSIVDKRQYDYLAIKILHYVFRYFFEKGYKCVRLLDRSIKSGSPDWIYRKIGLTYITNSGWMKGKLKHIIGAKVLENNMNNENQP